MSMIITSRQRAYQLRQNEKGLCMKCGERIYKAGLCEEHYHYNRIHGAASRDKKRRCA